MQPQASWGRSDWKMHAGSLSRPARSCAAVPACRGGASLWGACSQQPPRSLLGFKCSSVLSHRPTCSSQPVTPTPVKSTLCCLERIPRCLHEGTVCFSKGLQGKDSAVSWGVAQFSLGHRVSVCSTRLPHLDPFQLVFAASAFPGSWR